MKLWEVLQPRSLGLAEAAYRVARRVVAERLNTRL